MVSFLYDVAGRSEDAWSQTWERITIVEGGGLAKLTPGKTDADRENVLSPLSMELLEELGKNVTREGKVFKSYYSKHAGKPFNSANTLRKWLEKKIKKVELPAGNSIDANRW